MLGVSMNAQTWTGSDPAEGTFFLYNVGAQKFINVGDKSAGWGTNAYLTADYGLDFIFEAKDGAYTLNSNVSNGDDSHYLNTELWCDQGATPWTFTKADRTDINAYTIKNGDKYIVANAAGNDVEYTALSDTERDQWQIIGRADILANLNANTALGVKRTVATFFISDPDFGRNDLRMSPDKKVWTYNVEGGNKTIPGRDLNLGGTGNAKNYGCEFWNNTFDIHQDLTDLPNGIYEFEIYGYGTNGTTYIYATTTEGTTEKVFKNQTGAANFQTALDNIDDYGGNVTGLFQVTDGKLTIGVKRETNSNKDWCVIDQARLYFYGNYTFAEAYGADLKVLIDEAKAIESPSAPLTSAISAAETALSSGSSDQSVYSSAKELLDAAIGYDTAIKAANAIDKSQPMATADYNALEAAITTYGSLSSSDKDEIETAKDALETAVANANKSIKGYAGAPQYFAKMKKVLDNTNVYTQEAYDNYYGTWLADYNDKKLSADDAVKLTESLAYSTGWHSSNNIDDILLSTWTIGGEQAKNYDKALYINTWSVEGDTDGSEFYAPFFEYWTGDDNSLGANTIQTTITGLKPNAKYSLTMRARVRQTNNKTKIANGITMKVGEGDAVDISAGAQYNGGVFYIGNFSAVGLTDSEGTLTGTITVAENSNISWLSYYDVKYTEGEDLSAYVADYEFALNNVNTVLTNDVQYAAMQGDLSAAATTYATVDKNDKAALIAAKEALEGALAAYNAVVGPLKGNDISKWTTTGNNGEFVVNTWSGEGNTDGSNMKTPFTQNWIGKGTNLTDATMSYTVEGLTAGYYKVSALVRTLNEAGGATPAGSFIFANDAIERAYNGTACTNGVYDNPIVYGLVGADGKLTIGIKVIKANFNWVSWKNFVYEYVGTNLTSEIADNLIEEKATVENNKAVDAAQTAAIDALKSTSSDANYIAAGKAIEAAYKAEFAEESVEVSSDGYATYVSQHNLDFSATDIKAYTAKVDGSKVVLTKIDKVPAKTPVVLYCEGGKTQDIPAAATTDTPEESDLVAGKDAAVATTDGDYTNYILNNVSGIGFYRANDQFVAADRAYLHVKKTEGARLEIVFAGEATGINTVKAVADGEAIYNLNGQRVKSAKKGLYIVGGKKVMVK